MPEMLAQIKSLAEACGGTVSVAVRNISNGFDFSFNEDVRIGSASTIKVPILLEALRQARDGELCLDTGYAVTAEQRCDGSGVLRHLHDGLAITLKDLLTLMIIVSDNTATNIVIDTVGMDKVNSTLRAFGCTGTTLMRKMYDWGDIAQGRDNFVVAKEMADLLARIARREALGGEWDDMLLGMMRKQQFSDQLGLLLPEGILANKTGEANGAVNDCGVLTTDDFRYSIAVFTQDAPSIGEAKVTIGRISKVIYDAAGAGKSC
jgi:beta-lactamase class A